MLTREKVAYTEACMEAIEETRVRTNGAYYPTRWKLMVARWGRVEATKRLLRQDGVAYDVDGGARLHDYGLDHLSVEWAVLNPRWARLFDDEDRRLAFAAFELNLREQGAQVRG